MPKRKTIKQRSVVALACISIAACIAVPILNAFWHELSKNEDASTEIATSAEQTLPAPIEENSQDLKSSFSISPSLSDKQSDDGTSVNPDGKVNTVICSYNSQTQTLTIAGEDESRPAEFVWNDAASLLSPSNPENVRQDVEHVVFSTPVTLEGLPFSTMNGIDAMGKGYANELFSEMPHLKTVDLSKLDTSRVTCMDYMFYHSPYLTSVDLSNHDLSNVTSMRSMFEIDYGSVPLREIRDEANPSPRYSNLTSINLGNTDLNNVQNMYHMFYGQDSLTELEFPQITSTNLTFAEGMFGCCLRLPSFDASKLRVDNLSSLQQFFSSCATLDTLDLSSWNTSKVKSFRQMFWCASALKSINFSGVKTSSATDMSSMFSHCSALESLDLSGFDTSHVENMEFTFYMLYKVQDIRCNNLNTSNVKSFEGCFGICPLLQTLNLDGWSFQKAEALTGIFEGCSELTDLTVSFATTTTCLHSIGQMFRECGSINNVDLSSLCTDNITDASQLFANCSLLETWSLPSSFPSLKLAGYMFNAIAPRTSIDLQWLSSSPNVTDLTGMLGWIENLKTINLGSFNFTGVKFIDFFLTSTDIETVDVSNWDLSSVQSMRGCFQGCSKLREIRGLQNWDVSQCYVFERVFKGCTNLSDLTGLASWSVSSGAYCNDMFSNAGIQIITFGSGWEGALNDSVSLWTPTGSQYTGKWKNSEKGLVLTTAELLSDWSYATKGGLWVAQITT